MVKILKTTSQCKINPMCIISVKIQNSLSLPINHVSHQIMLLFVKNNNDEVSRILNVISNSNFRYNIRIISKLNKKNFQCVIKL